MTSQGDGDMKRRRRLPRALEAVAEGAPHAKPEGAFARKKSAAPDGASSGAAAIDLYTAACAPKVRTRMVVFASFVSL